MPNPIFYSHRSGVETYQRCPRAGFLNYHYLGMGIQAAPQAIWLDIGNAVHIGLAQILQGHAINDAVNAALTFYMESDQPIFRPTETQEQTWLIECLLWAFFLHFWPSFQKGFDILYVEEEIDTEYEHSWDEEFDSLGIGKFKLLFSSRPDAICRSKVTKEMVGISWKTIDSLTDYRKNKFGWDLQGFTEMYYADQQMRRQAEVIKDQIKQLTESKLRFNLKKEMILSLELEIEKMGQGVDVIQTIFLQKGRRKYAGVWSPDGEEVDQDDPQKEYMVDSFITRPWFNETTEQFAHASSFPKEKNKSGEGKLGKDWRRVKAFEFISDFTFKDAAAPVLSPETWVNYLRDKKAFPSNDFPSIENPLNWMVVYPESIQRNPAMMDEIIEQTIAQELRKCQDLLELADATNLDDKSVLLAQKFPQYMHSCLQDYKCQFMGICHSQDEQVRKLDFAAMPKGYEKRRPHHETERKMLEGEK